MAILIEHPISKQVFLTDEKRETVYSFNGTPYRAPEAIETWTEVQTREVRCLFDWQKDPGRYGPYWALVQIGVQTTPDEKPEFFTAGGSWVYITAWLDDRASDGMPTVLRPIAMYADRQTARDNAEVQW